MSSLTLYGTKLPPLSSLTGTMPITPRLSQPRPEFRGHPHCLSAISILRKNAKKCFSYHGPREGRREGVLSRCIYRFGPPTTVQFVASSAELVGKDYQWGVRLYTHTGDMESMTLEATRIEMVTHKPGVLSPKATIMIYLFCIGKTGELGAMRRLDIVAFLGLTGPRTAYQTSCATTALGQVRWVSMDPIVQHLLSRANSLAAKFAKRGKTSCIDTAIELDREALKRCQPGHSERPVSLTWLAAHLRDRHNSLGVMADLEEAIMLDREALDLRPIGHPDRSVSLNHLAAGLCTRFKRLGVTEDLDEALVLCRGALELCSEGHPDRSPVLNNLAVHLSARYHHLGVIDDLNEAISFEREALDLCPKGDPDRSSSLNNLAASLFTRYNQLGAAEDVMEAIVLCREILDLRPIGHRERWSSLNSLAFCLSTRHKQLGVMEDLEEAIVLRREALELLPRGHPDRSISLDNLAAGLCKRYMRLRVIEDLNEAIVLGREAFELHPSVHPDRWSSLNSLALCLSTRYKRLGTMEDLNEALVLGRGALELCPQGHPDRSTSLNNLANDLSTQYSQLGVVEDLDEGIVLGREALELRPHGHPDRSKSLDNLATDLSARYKRLGHTEDLNEAIVLGREALDLRPEGHPDRSSSLTNLAAYLSIQYKKLGVMEDLDEAIVLSREALELRPTGHPDRSLPLNNLAICLSARYNEFGIMEDLHEAIVLNQEALDLCPQGHPDRSASLQHLADSLSIRYEELEIMEDLDESIRLAREALGLRPKGHPDRLFSLNNLAGHLTTRYKQLGVLEDLREAIALNRESLDFHPKYHHDRSTSLNNLAFCLSARYDSLGVMEDLDEAITLDREAFDIRPKGHPDWSKSLNNLACRLRSRFARLKQLQDVEELFGLYGQLVHVTQNVSSNDLSAAKGWISEAEDFKHPTLVLAYQTSLRLLVQHLAIIPSLPQHLDTLKNLTSSLAMDAFSACLRNNSPAKAVELLEQGRGVFWSQLSRLHSPLDDVIASGLGGRKLADEFMHLASLIRKDLDSPGADQHGQLCHLNLKLQKVVADIRKLPGLSHFLLPPLFSDLQQAASGGPVIIVNASKCSCDAVVVPPDRNPVHIPLQITQESVRNFSIELHALNVHAKKGDVTRELAGFLRKLWDQIVSPIVDFLRTTYPLESRIWWCPTAEFSVLPLHAAGPFRSGQRNLPDLYISSYTPTLTALIRARRHVLSDSATEGRRFVAIGQSKAAGETELPFVGAELDNVGQLVRNFVTFTRIDREESCISRIIEELGKNEWVHLACHGLPNQSQPFESGFALHDGHFTIQQIIKCDLKNPEFIYLSASHTTVGDAESPDEVIHLASAMQFVGFRSVIGTMWAVDDSATTKITSTFYRHMVDESGRLDHTRAALALNKTMKTVDIPLDQRILYIHLGA